MEKLGYLPEAVINWVALMGWSYDDRTEFFTLNDLIEKFSLDRLNPSPAAINFSKLDHFNGLHIRALDKSDLARRIKPFLEEAGFQVSDDLLLRIVPIIQERLVTLDDAIQFAGFFFVEDIYPAADELTIKNVTPDQIVEIIRRAYQILETIDPFISGRIDQALRRLR